MSGVLLFWFDDDDKMNYSLIFYINEILAGTDYILDTPLTEYTDIVYLS